MKKLLLVSTALLTSSPVFAVIPQSNQLVFEITRNGQPFGTHKISFDKQGTETHVQIDINMQYDLGPITLFRYKHSNTEIWEDDQILSMTSQTNDDGDNYAVSASWGNVVKATANGADFEAPANIYSTSYWNPAALKASQLLNTQKGRIEDVKVTNIGQEQIETANETVTADRYKVDTVIPLEVLYDTKTKEWVGLEFNVRGSDIKYRRITPTGQPIIN